MRQASVRESVSNASTDSGRSVLQVMASPWKGKLSTGVGGARLGKHFLVNSTCTLSSKELVSYSFSFLVKNSVDSGIRVL